MAKRTSTTSRQAKTIHDANHRYFTIHFASLVRKHGGKWIVLAEGKLIGIGGSADIPALMEKARAAAPSTIPFLAPIPTPEDLECVL